MEVHARIGLVVSAKDSGQSCQHARSYEANVERAYFSAGDALRLVNITLDVAKRPTSALQESIACGSQAHRARRSREKWMAQHLFELANLLRKGWLAHVEPLCRAAKVKFFGHGHKVAKVSQFDVFIHMPNIIIQCDKILDISFSSRQSIGREVEDDAHQG
jgi:hypothetical protein